MEINIITGASGFVGKHLLKRLLESGKNVWIIMRSLNGVTAEERAKKLFNVYLDKFPDTFRVLEGDITMESLGIDPVILQVLHNEKVIFWHLAANLSFSSKQKDSVICTNYTGTVNTINLANKIAKKYIYVSTAYVCGDTTTLFNENDLDVGQKFRNHYESSKFEAEKYIRNNCKAPYSIFRPSIIMGDAYEGKAEGCTFGYYRFAYIFHIFKKWLIDKLLNGSFLAKKTLVLLGTKYDKKSDILEVPWLFLPYTPDGTVDMIPIDSVIYGLLIGMNNAKYDGQTIHLTNPEPPLFKWVLSSLVEDLGYQKVKYFKISPTFFIMSLKTLYFICVPLRVKVKSAMCYLPYITRRYYFSHKNNKTLGLSEKIPITREFLRKINLYAKEEIFNKINVE